MDSIRQYFKRTDKMYLLLCIFSSVMAVLALSSWAAKQGNGFATDEVTGAIIGIGDYRRALVQAGAAAIGIVIALLLSCVDYRSLVKVWPVHVVLTWGLVLPTLVIRNVSIGPLTIGYNAGDTDNYSWYKLGGFTFQPTELAKISFILTFAMHLNNVRSRINEPKELAKLLLHLLVPIAIIHVQGDDGTAIIYGIIGCCMMFAAGLSWKYIFAAFAAAGAAVAVAFAFFSDKIGKGYQWYRILAVLDPENTTGWAPSETVWKNIIYQQQRGEIALGSGGIFGNGLFGGRYYSVPNAHNDFILSWIGNVAGFVGCCVVLGVLLALVIKTFATGARSEDLLGSYICAGIGGALMAQIAVNVGMNLRVLPVIGVIHGTQLRRRPEEQLRGQGAGLVQLLAALHLRFGAVRILLGGIQHIGAARQHITGDAVHGAARLACQHTGGLHHIVVDGGHLQHVSQRGPAAILVQVAGDGGHVQSLTVRGHALGQRSGGLGQAVVLAELDGLAAVLGHRIVIRKLVMHQPGLCLVDEALLVEGLHLRGHGGGGVQGSFGKQLNVEVVHSHYPFFH